MVAFRILLAAMWAAIAVYTAIVVRDHGIDLFTPFFGDIAAMRWPGQFNVDFMSFLVLSALWLAWRHKFSPRGVLIGVIGFFGGMFFLAPYLLIASIKAKGNMREVMMGEGRV